MSIPMIFLARSPLIRNHPLMRRVIASAVVGTTLGLMAGAPRALAQQTSDGAAAPSTSSAQASAKAAALAVAQAQAAAQATAQAKGKPGKQGKQGKNVYTGPTTVVVLPPTPMLDDEGKQRVDPDGKLMFNAPIQQLRDKKGHPIFDTAGKPVFQAGTNLGYNEQGKKILVKKERPPKMMPVSIRSGILTVDGWTGKARLNYDIRDLKYLYVYAPGVGIVIVSQNAFPGAKAQAGAFNDQTLRVTADGHTIELWSEKHLLGNKPQDAWVMVDRGSMLPTKFPVFGYGATTKAPYSWPGSKQDTEATGVVKPPPLPVDVRPTLLLAPCPAGMMRQAAGPTALPGDKAQEQPCVPIQSAPASTAAPKATQVAEPAH